MDVEWVVQKLLRMERWMGTLCHTECVPSSDEDVLWEFKKGGWVHPGGH